jgi:hypothetical protein
VYFTLLSNGFNNFLKFWTLFWQLFKLLVDKTDLFRGLLLSFVKVSTDYLLLLGASLAVFLKHGPSGVSAEYPGYSITISILTCQNLMSPSLV